MEDVSPRLAADEPAALALTLGRHGRRLRSSHTETHGAAARASSEDCHHPLCNMASVNVTSTASCKRNSHSQEAHCKAQTILAM